jgi:glycosyltransferase involved in cell wall biosynthesis
MSSPHGSERCFRIEGWRTVESRKDREINVLRLRLRIAQIAPLFESVPPRLYAGTERVIAYLCQELKQRGHDVTLFASGDSTSAVRLKPSCATSLRISGLERFRAAYHLSMLSEVCEHTEQFDIIHYHIDYWSFPFQRMMRPSTVSTMHSRMDHPELDSVYRYYKDLPLVSISNAQRSRLPDLRWVRTVYHGLPEQQWKLNPAQGKYFSFLGRFSPEKVARRAGVPLKMAAKVDHVDREYFDTVVKPLLSTPGIEYVGEISEPEKQQFLGEALALLFPIDWAEPFGLVMIEALACGTPVIARPCGSVPEVLKDGISGLIASDVDGLVEAVRRVGDLPRPFVRKEFETRFTATIMATHYEGLYYDLIERVHQSLSPQQPRLYAYTAASATHSVSAKAESTLNAISSARNGFNNER